MSSRIPKPGYDNQGVDLAAAKRHLEREEKLHQQGVAESHARFAESIEKVPLADWTTVEGIRVLRSGNSRFVAAPHGDRENARMFDVIDLETRQLVAQLRRSEIYM